MLLFLAFFILFRKGQLNLKKFGGIERILPNLEILDRINYRLIFWGFPIYTVALVVGFVKYLSLLGFLLDPKEIWSFLTWIVYLAIFFISG